MYCNINLENILYMIISVIVSISFSSNYIIIVKYYSFMLLHVKYLN